MKAHEYRFLRGSSYLWLVRVAELLPDVLHRARVPIVGDLPCRELQQLARLRAGTSLGGNDVDEMVRSTTRDFAAHR